MGLGKPCAQTDLFEGCASAEGDSFLERHDCVRVVVEGKKEEATWEAFILRIVGPDGPRARQLCASASASWRVRSTDAALRFRYGLLKLILLFYAFPAST